MRRAHLEHLIRAAGQIAEDLDLIVIGSQSILASIPNPPASLTVSMEADIYPRTYPDRADDIDGTIGEGSSFHESYGYYAQGVGPETATVPEGWQQRLVKLATPATNGITGWCLEVHDLAIAKLVAGRPKDLMFVTELAKHKLVARHVLEERLAGTTVSDAVREAVQGRIVRSFS